MKTLKKQPFANKTGFRLQLYSLTNRFLPIANINRIMKKVLPGNAKIARDAKETVQECVSEFISFITSEYLSYFATILKFPFRASEKCYQDKRKTINGEDILYAMKNLGFDQYVECLAVYLQKYREVTRIVFISVYSEQSTCKRAPKKWRDKSLTASPGRSVSPILMTPPPTVCVTCNKLLINKGTAV